ncbi:hypothetical protein, conserved [Plasmodium ovale curtisi]|uniref:Uncharacterized protein n=1 Tax=Plasmodium ovale curtisi TaxID=864141 RepID=A0A1A8W365_PLAOA|nr:hypothetical protein, conserved [Plasmodium ovale curtisi]
MEDLNPGAGKGKNSLKNASSENEKKKKKKKKKIISKDKVENEDKIEVTEKKELLDNFKVNTFDENMDKLLGNIIPYMEIRKGEVANVLLAKYYYVDKKTPFFFIDINVYKCMYDSFFNLPLVDNALSSKINNSPYDQNSIYFYNVINSKCLNTIFYFLKEFFKENELEHFENGYEIMQLTYFFFFILLTDYYTVNKNIEKYCSHNFKILFMLKNYLFQKYMKYTNESVLKKYFLLNKVENDYRKNNFFIFETKIVNELSNDNKIQFENMTICIISAKKLANPYFFSVVIKNKSYEYMNDLLFLDLFRILVFTTTNVSPSLRSPMPRSTQECCGKENDCGDNTDHNTNIYLIPFNHTNSFAKEEKENAFSYVYEIEVPSHIYSNQEIEVYYIEENPKAKNTTFFESQNSPFLWDALNSLNRMCAAVEKTEENFPKKEDAAEEDVSSSNALEDHSSNRNYAFCNYTHKCNEKGYTAGEKFTEEEITHRNTLNGYDINKSEICEQTRESPENYCNEKNFHDDEIKLVKVECEKFSINEKTYLKIYSNRISNYYINLNSIANFPYSNWEIKYTQNDVIIKLQSKISNTFTFHINNNGIVLLDNGIDVLRDTYNLPLDVYTLLFVMKKRGINFLVTDIEMKKIQTEYNYHLNNRQTEQNIINDILLCFRFITFYSSNQRSEEPKTTIRIRGNEDKLNDIFTDSLHMEYEHNFCRIVKMETEDNEKRFTKNLSKHKSLLFCLFELSEFTVLNNRREKKTMIENTKQENGEDDNKKGLIAFQYFLMAIFSYYNIEKMNDVIIKENDNLKRDSYQMEWVQKFSEGEYNDIFELNETVESFCKKTERIKRINFGYEYMHIKIHEHVRSKGVTSQQNVALKTQAAVYYLDQSLFSVSLFLEFCSLWYCEDFFFFLLTMALESNYKEELRM